MQTEPNEIVYEGILPARPEMPAPRKSRRGWVAGAAVAGLIALGIGGFAARSDTTDPVTTSTPPVVAAPEAPTGDVYGQAADLSNQVVDELDAVQHSTTLDEMAEHTYNAADLTQQTADLFVGVDSTEVMYLSSAADHLYASGDALAAGDIRTATSEVNAYTADINAATDALS